MSRHKKSHFGNFKHKKLFGEPKIIETSSKFCNFIKLKRKRDGNIVNIIKNFYFNDLFVHSLRF